MTKTVQLLTDPKARRRWYDKINPDQMKSRCPDCGCVGAHYCSKGQETVVYQQQPE